MGLAYVGFNRILALADAVLAELDLGRPSILYLTIAALAALSAAAQADLIGSISVTLRSAGHRVQLVTRALLWVACFYIVLRFPIAAFAALPVSIGRGLLALVLYSMLFVPLWIGLLVFAVKVTRVASTLNAEPKRKRFALRLLAACPLLGVIGEIRMLLDPSLIDRLNQF